MKKQKIFPLIAIALVIVLLSAGYAIAGGKRTYFEGTRCRSEFSSISEVVNGRLIQTISEAVWPITTGNELVDGVWFNYDTKSDRAILEILDRPPFYILGSGYIGGRLMIIPDAVNGYWEGNVQMVWQGEDAFTHAVLKGKGDLSGMKLVIDMKNPDVSETGILCSMGGWLDFHGYILKPWGNWRRP